METLVLCVSPRAQHQVQTSGPAGRFYRHRALFPVVMLIVTLALPVAAAPAASTFAGELGAIVQKSPGGQVRGTHFRVWAPQARTVEVLGSFNNWRAGRHALRKEGTSGVWSLEVRGAKPGDEYVFLINGELERKDPRARKVTASHGRSVIYDTSAFDWGRSHLTRPTVPLEDLVIYQLHPGTFHDPAPDNGRPGTLRDAVTKLDHLVDLGVNCVLLMPVNEFPGDHSWGYNPSDLFAVESAYGGPDALKEFVRACHERGLAVHLDIVHNHYGPDDLDLWQFDGSGGGETGAGIYFYEDAARAATPWGPRPDFGRREVVQFIEDQVRMWFDEYRIDGLRWDSTINIRALHDGAEANPQGEQLLDRLSRMIRRDYPGRLSIAEDSVGDRRFDASWELAFHGEGEHGVVPQLLRSTDADRRLGEVVRQLECDLGFRRVIYTENHDETGRLNGKHRLITGVDPHDPRGVPARRKNALAAVLTLTSPGVPLLFMGQELLEHREFHDSNPLDWQMGGDSFHAFLLHRDLVRLRRNLDGRSQALGGTRARVLHADEDRNLLVFRRFLPGRPDEDLVVVINLSAQPVADCPVAFPQSGTWHLLFNSDDRHYGCGFTGVRTMADRTDGQRRLAVRLAPYSAQVFGRRPPAADGADYDAWRAVWDRRHGLSASGRLAAH
jgi:1,4-alpha-glucan branching enzyme